MVGVICRISLLLRFAGLLPELNAHIHIPQAAVEVFLSFSSHHLTAVADWSTSVHWSQWLSPECLFPAPPTEIEGRPLSCRDDG